MGEIEKLIKNKSFRIHDKITELIPSTNGIANDDIMDIHSLGSIQRATMSLDSFVNISQKYPEENHTEVTFETDLIVIKSSAYKNILEKIIKLENSNNQLDRATEILSKIINVDGVK